VPISALALEVVVKVLIGLAMAPGLRVFEVHG
jgi:hypothetical protein